MKSFGFELKCATVRILILVNTVQKDVLKIQHPV